jgi:hypothetical protein
LGEVDAEPILEIEEEMMINTNWQEEPSEAPAVP